MNNDPRIGQLHETGQPRDAIHIALASVVAGHPMSPGQHVGFIKSSPTVVGFSTSPIGIVDPFLKEVVKEGQRFWLFLYPNTVTSLRHEWEHPAFLPPQTEHKSASVKIIEQIAAKCDLTYNALMSAADDYVEDGYPANRGNDQHAGDVFWDNHELFWEHYEKIRGVSVKVKDETIFTCSC